MQKTLTRVHTVVKIKHKYWKKLLIDTKKDFMSNFDSTMDLSQIFLHWFAGLVKWINYYVSINFQIIFPIQTIMKW